MAQDEKVATHEKWPVFEKAWARTKHTAYAYEVWWMLKNIFGESDLTLDGLERAAAKIRDMKASYLGYFDDLNIKALLVNILSSTSDLRRCLKGEISMPDRFKLVIPLPNFHGGVRSFEGIQEVAGIVEGYATSIDSFLELVYKAFRGLKARGAVGFKDQSAYTRTLDFETVARCEAEALFNECLRDARNSLGWPQAKPLDDFLFHQYMRFAEELGLPVQIHTGHMAGNWNRVEKTNAAYLAKVLELHRNVRFDLFHGNWPYLGDLLFLAKNYPNVYIDLCWVNIIDPGYTIELLERVLYTVPHAKINGFGGDYGTPEVVGAHLDLARRNIARALANAVEKGWIKEVDALQVAADWLFNNPNQLFNLGLSEYSP